MHLSLNIICPFCSSFASYLVWYKFSGFLYTRPFFTSSSPVTLLFGTDYGLNTVTIYSVSLYPVVTSPRKVLTCDDRPWIQIGPGRRPRMPLNPGQYPCTSLPWPISMCICIHIQKPNHRNTLIAILIQLQYLQWPDIITVSSSATRIFDLSHCLWQTVNLLHFSNPTKIFNFFFNRRDKFVLNSSFFLTFFYFFIFIFFCYFDPVLSSTLTLHSHLTIITDFKEQLDLTRCEWKYSNSWMALRVHSFHSTSCESFFIHFSSI